MGSFQSETQRQNGIYHIRTCLMTWFPGKLCKSFSTLSPTLLSFFAPWTPLDHHETSWGCKMTYRLASSLQPTWLLLL